MTTTEPVADPLPTDTTPINDYSTDSLVVLLDSTSTEDPSLETLLGTGDGTTDGETTDGGTTGDGTAADDEEGTADADGAQDETNGTPTSGSDTDSTPAPKKVLSCVG